MSPIYIFIAAVLLIVTYALSCWTSDGKRLGLFFLPSKFDDWEPLGTPPRSRLLPFIRYAIYHRKRQIGDHARVRKLFFKTARIKAIQRKMGRLFRKGGGTEYYARRMRIRWLLSLRASKFYLIIPRFPRSAGGWAQAHPEVSNQAEKCEWAKCILGMERFILGRSRLAKSTATHEMIHVAQELRDNLLSDERSGVGLIRALRAEFEAHMNAPGAPIILLAPTALIIIMVNWYIRLRS